MLIIAFSFCLVFYVVLINLFQNSARASLIVFSLLRLSLSFTFISEPPYSGSYMAWLLSWLSLWAFLVAQRAKNLPAMWGDPGLIPGSGRSPGEGHGNPLQYPCLDNPMDRGAWRATVRRVTKSQTRLSY